MELLETHRKGTKTAISKATHRMVMREVPLTAEYVAYVRGPYPSRFWDWVWRKLGGWLFKKAGFECVYPGDKEGTMITHCGRCSSRQMVVVGENGRCEECVNPYRWVHGELEWLHGETQEPYRPLRK